MVLDRYSARYVSSLEESRYYLILAPDLGYGQTDHLMSSADTPFLLLAPEFWLPYPAAF